MADGAAIAVPDAEPAASLAAMPAPSSSPPAPDSNEDDLSLKKSELALPSPPPPSKHGDDDGPGDFDCNVCYDTAREPVVTMCGHLYCWPCLYR